MPTNILMPALSPTMEKGNLAKWLKKEGDQIKSGDVIAEIETDKATMEVEAVDEGVLAKIVVPEGTADVPVNDVIAVIAGEGEDAKAVGAAGAAPPAKKADEKPKDEAPKQEEKAAPAPASTNGSGQRAPQAAATPAPQPQAQTNGAGRVFASPLARRMAKEGGLDLAAIQGSGPHGRIVERDVKAAIEGGTAKKAQPGAPAAQPGAPAPKLAPAGMSDDIVKKMFEPGSFEEVPHDGMRKTIARRLTEAKQTIPHFYLTVDCDIDALLKLREQVNASAQKDKDGKPAFKVSVNDMVIKALALALVRTPGSNVTFTENSMLHHKHADISVAVAIPGGLITPVIRKADLLTLSGIANAMKDFAARAKDRKLKPEEYQGGTSAVSNLGMYGIKDFVAVINPPQSSIIAVGMGEKRAVVKNGEIVIGNVMSVTISCDHRAMDGAKGAELIAAFKQLIENPMGMLV
ncbi:MAG TPA: pyruvate dehydrogenase complex dihydrolipoamide acetyltransferase [Beijerinckiaceae bacterium]|jgi:pyruvate dehydrogenase E2 component (dihydrolipoamide acetyltransferase)|nr:pyruvate dehydrogenase complex dihydrolipoamide acetyltransferase [Beijerinckiaceae bacterium]